MFGSYSNILTGKLNYNDKIIDDHVYYIVVLYFY